MTSMVAEFVAAFAGTAQAVVGNRLLMTNIEAGIKAVINFIVFSLIPLVDLQD